MDPRVKKAIDFIHENYHQSLDLKTMAGVACLAPNYFHLKFKREMGVSPRKYLETIKLKRALARIIYGQQSILNISIEYGFNDYETFTRVFTKHYGISPFDLRNVLGEIPEIKCVESKPEIIVTQNPTDLHELSKMNCCDHKQTVYKVSRKRKSSPTRMKATTKFNITKQVDYAAD